MTRAAALDALMWSAHDLRTHLSRTPGNGAALAHHLSLWGHVIGTAADGAALTDAVRTPSALHPMPRPATLRALADFLRALADFTEVDN